MTGRRIAPVSVVVRPAHEGSVVCVPDIHGELTELPHGVWSTVPATPGVLTAIRSGALQVKKRKQTKKATPPYAPEAAG